MSAPTPAERARVIAGLRELADLLEANPALPVTKYPVFGVHAGAVDTGLGDDDDDACCAFVDQAAAVLGTEITDRHGHYVTTWMSRGEEPYDAWRMKYEVSRIRNAAMAEHLLRRSYDDVVQVPA